jgi:hypothetical protein
VEQAGGIGTWIAQGAIALFLLLLIALFIRTALMVGSVFLLAWTRRNEPPKDGVDDPPAS